MKNLLAAIGCVACFAASAQPTLVQDINPGFKGSNPRNFSIFNGKLYFKADTDSFGTELWMHDGVNTSMVTNTTPRYPLIISTIGMTGVVGNSLYFSAADTLNSEELWRYDGVNAPVMVANIAPNPYGSSPCAMNALDGKLYFHASTPATGSEMHVYDPATNQVSLLVDILPGAPHGVGSISCVFNNKLYFTGGDKTLPLSLWVHDPVANTTTTVAGAPGMSITPNFTAIGNKMYFVGFSAAFGTELYVYDGINAPVRLTDAVPGPPNGIYAGNNDALIAYKNRLYFTSAQPTGMVLTGYDPAAAAIAPLLPAKFTYHGNYCLYADKIYYSGMQQDSGNVGMELYCYDGYNNPQLAADVIPGSQASGPANFIVYDKHLYFSGETVYNGRELYKFYDSKVNEVSDVAFTAVVKVFPNPSSDIFSMDINLEQAATFAIQVFDMTGKKVYDAGMRHCERGKHQIFVPAAALVPGNYILKLHRDGDDALYTTRLVKQ